MSREASVTAVISLFFLKLSGSSVGICFIILVCLKHFTVVVNTIEMHREGPPMCSERVSFMVKVG